MTKEHAGFIGLNAHHIHVSLPLSPRGRFGACHVDESLLTHLGAKRAVKCEEARTRTFRAQPRPARCADFYARHNMPLWYSDGLSATQKLRLRGLYYLSCVS